MSEETIQSWDELLAVDDAEYVDVPVGKKIVRLGSLSSAEMLVWIRDQDDDEKAKTGGLVLVAKCIVDSDGKRIGKLEDMIRLREKQPKTVKRLVRAAIDLNELEVKTDSKNVSSGTEPSAASIESGSQPETLTSAS